MNLHVFPVEDIVVPPNRQRKVFNEQAIQELAASIADNGLIAPLVVRQDNGGGELILVSGERRLRALDIVWGFGQEVRCGTKIIPEKHVPCLYLGEIDPVLAFEIELEENIRRTDYSWQERSQATARLFELRRLQAEREGKPVPTPATLAEEVSGTSEGQYQENVREDLILARHLDNPAIAKALSRKEAFKALKRIEEQKRNAELGERIGANFSSAMHTLRQGNCLEILPTMQEQFDVILTDPPYGIGADEFGDSGGKTAGSHFYEDSPAAFKKLIEGEYLPSLLRDAAKPQAHLYFFCDIDWFVYLKERFTEIGWKVFRTPLIWVNPTAMRTPWPERGPQRKWQAILYAVKGDKNCTRIYSDVISCPSDENLGHQAQKPVGLYVDLLRRSVRPGDAVLDPFAGTGTIYPAAHQFKCRATGIEMDAAAAGIAAKRIEELK